MPAVGRLWPSDDDGDDDDEDDDDEGEDNYDDDSPLQPPFIPSHEDSVGIAPPAPTTPDGYFHTVPYSPNLNDRLIDTLGRDATVISG